MAESWKDLVEVLFAVVCVLRLLKSVARFVAWARKALRRKPKPKRTQKPKKKPPRKPRR